MDAVSAATGASRIEAAFASHGKRAALMPYLMGGYPSPEDSLAAGLAAADAGADLIELGVPFSDPLADGPVIHAAGTAALAAGVRPADVLEVCGTLSERVPVVLMTYANVVLVDGADAYARRAADAGAAGLIVPDLPQEEAAAVRAACDSAGIALVPLVAPSSTPERVAEVGERARGFVYAVSLAGTTGEREQLPPELPRLVERVRAAASVPVAVGFGISTPAQATAVGELADGVIVGSRVVRAAGEGGAQAVGAVVAELAEALRPTP
jgi:tryptophan synthase alpha chain